MTAADARRLAFLSELGPQVAQHVADASNGHAVDPAAWLRERGTRP